MRYLALDVETAAAMPWSVCQIGVVGFDALGETDAFGTLVQPGCVFAPFNIRIHGIDDDIVAGAPDFATAFAALAPRLDELLTTLAFDAQTSGGLILGVPEDKLPQATAILAQAGDLACVIGRAITAASQPLALV